MKNTDLTFEIEEHVLDYCDSCQPLGPSETGVKVHRSIPLDTRSVKGHIPNEEPKFLVMCADCLARAMDGGVNVVLDGKPWDKKNAMFFHHSPA